MEHMEGQMPTLAGIAAAFTWWLTFVLVAMMTDDVLPGPRMNSRN